MKQVGLNVAADPLMSLAYMGVKGGMVIVVADDQALQLAKRAGHERSGVSPSCRFPDPLQ